MTKTTCGIASTPIEAILLSVVISSASALALLGLYLLSYHFISAMRDRHHADQIDSWTEWWVGLALAGNVIFATVLPTSISGNAAAINVIYGITYPILCAGVALLPNHRRPGAAMIGMTEGAIIAACVAVIWWMVFVDPTLIDTQPE